MMDLGPSVVNNPDMNYRAVINQENQRALQTAQQEFNMLQQEYQNNPGNVIFYRDQNSQPLLPVWNAPVPFDFMLQTTLDHYNNNYINPAHRHHFPMGDHMLGLIFLANSDLTEQQRERLTSHLAYRNILMRSYTLDIIFEGCKTLFTSTKTITSDLLVRHSGLQRRHARHCSFYLFEASYWDDEEGYWAIDEENDDEEGFLDLNKDIFWTFNQESDDWERTDVIGHRRTRHGKGSKGKGKRRFKMKFRGRFRPFKKTGKTHLADNDYDAEEWLIVDNSAQSTG